MRHHYPSANKIKKQMAKLPHSGIWNKRKVNNSFMLCQIWAILQVKMARKMTVIPAVISNNKYIQKLLTNHFDSSDYDCALLKRFAQYLVFVFLPPQKKRNEQRTYRLA